LKVEIEKNKNKNIEKIKIQTTEELKKLEEKYKMTDTVKQSFGVLAYVLIGIFIFIISIGDFVRLVRYLRNKFEEIKMSPAKNDFNKNQKKTTKEDNKPVDYNKIRQFDDRVLEMQIKFVKSKKPSS